jgi:hypothetical protein
MGRTLGAWAFLVGVILAVIIGGGVGEATSTTVGVLALLGIIVGLLNVSEELVVVSGMGGDAISEVPGLGSTISGILSSIMILFVPATIVVALKSVFSLAKE